ncbi:MAG TPA: DUF3052 family protein [Herpetosiphonaceae bacterium]|nr:DUF3052 family protein [Herpetosiphonaceae bacterium]
MAQSLAQKLQIKPGRSLLLVAAPAGYAETLGDLPADSRREEAPADIVQLFVRSRAELEERLDAARAALNPGGILWVTYPKGTSKTMKADVNRDSINAYAHSLGLEGVAMVAIDEDWSALRLKVAE